MLYLSGVSSPTALAVAETGRIGFLRTPRSVKDSQITPACTWAADNDCYSLGDRFDLGVYLAWLDRLDLSRCLWATAPDVVGDAAATRERSLPVLPLLRERGLRVAYVAQDGLTPATAPWTDIDVLFLGGTTDWKLSTAAADLAHHARDRGLPVHMGRANSHRRLLHAAKIGCDSADGTFLRWSPDANVPRMLAWLDRLAERPLLPLG